MELRTICSKSLTERREVVALLFLELYDYLCLCPKPAPAVPGTPGNEAINVMWMKQHYLQCLDDMNSYVSNDGIDTIYEHVK